MIHDPSCGCCGGLKPETPADEVNPPGQTALNYRVGTHARFLESQRTRLSASSTLAALTTRAQDDPTLALLDAWSAVLDVLSFYQERVVNEGFLRTATERRSVLELGRAIGYELRPGVAASTFLAFTLETAPGAPSVARIDAGAKVQSVPGQDEQPQVFETLEAVTTRPAWNALEVVQYEASPPRFGGKVLYLKGQNTRLQPGDALLIVGDEREKNPGSENWDLRRVTQVLVVPPAEPSLDALAGYTVVSLDEPLGSIAPHVEPAKLNARCFALRSRASFFGQAAADWKTMPASLRAGYLGLNDDKAADFTLAPDWPGFTLADLSDPPTTTATGTGLYGEYFQGRTFDSPKATRTDAKIAFNFVATPPPSAVGAHHFCVRWTGWVQLPKTGNYTFSVRSDDGVRLWVDGKLLVDKWILQGPTTHTSAPVHFSAGQKVDLRLEYFENDGGAIIELSWSGPDAAGFIPTDRLYPRDVHTVHLDASYPKWVVGSWVVLSIPEYQELYQVVENVEDGRTAFALSGKTSRLKLRGEQLRELFNARIRGTSVLGESHELPWATRPVSGLLGGHSLLLDTLQTELPAGRWLAVSGRVLAELPENTLARARLLAKDELAALELDKRGFAATLTFADGKRYRVTLASAAEIVRLLHIDEVDGRSRLTLESDLQHAYLPLTVRINANVATASHGDSKQMRIQPELLGSGDGSASFQRFTLQQWPLTYVSAPTPSGTSSTLDVRVDGVAWKEASTLSELAATDHAYLLRRTDEGKTVVQFGDGEHGSRLPTGQLNLSARYRVGIGLQGNVDAGKLSLLLNRPLGVKEVDNPVPASGGADPESRQQARRNAPLTVLTLERIVSLLDFESFAAAFAGVGKAQAVWLWNGQERLVYVTITGVDGAAIEKSSALYQNLFTAIDGARPAHQGLRLEPGVVLRLGLDASLRIDPTYVAKSVLSACRAALEQAFGFSAREYGQSLSGSEVVSALQRTPGVLRVDLDRLRARDGAQVTTAEGPDGRLRALGARFQGTSILPAQLLLLDAADVNLTEVTS